MTDIGLLTAYRSAGETAPDPVTVLVNGAPTQIELVEKLRALPGKRAVYKARRDNKCVLVKIFAGKNAERDFAREKQGVGALTQSGISTPALLTEAQLADSREPVLITEFLENAISFKQQWHEVSDNDRVNLLKMIMRTVGQHHQAGLYQQDIHLDNFLLKDNTVFTIDGGAIESGHQGKPLPEKTRVNNLALFFAQWEPSFDSYIEEALYFYHQATNVHLSLADVVDGVERCRATRWRRYQKKLYRSCSEFVCEQTPQQFLMCRRDYFTPVFANWLADLNAQLQHEDSLSIKNGVTATVVKLECDGHALIVKRYNIKNVWHRLSRLFRPSRAWNAWRSGYLLRFFGVNTPLPIALIEERFGPLRGAAFLVTEAVPGVSLNQAVINNVECITEVSEQIKKMAAARISHGDMKATNFMIDGVEAYLIDLDATKQHHGQYRFTKEFADDIARFLRNWDSQSEVKHAFEIQLRKL